MKPLPEFPIFATPPAVAKDAKSYRVQIVAATEDKCAEILVHGPIGRSFWSEDGITGKDFTDALNQIPVGTKVVVGINSQGGSVNEGLAIFNAIARRKEDVTCRIDGYALSIASYFPLAASKVISPKSALWMIHNVWSWADGCSGNADDMRKQAELMQKAADMLEKHDDVLVAAYCDRTGKSEKEIRSAMQDETWLTGEEAVQWGLADEECETEAALDALDFSGMEPKAFKKIPSNCRSLILAAAGGAQTRPAAPAAAHNHAPKAGAKTTENKTVMNRQQMLALLKSWGVEVNDSMTDDNLVALVGKGKPQAAAPGNVVDINAEIQKGISAATKAMERKSDAKEALAKLVTEKRITQAQADRALPTILAETGEVKDSAVLATLRENPVMPEPAEPVSNSGGEISGDASPMDTVKAIARFSEPVKAWQRGNDVSMKAITQASLDRAHFITKHGSKIIPVMNANTVPAGLKRSVIMQTVIKDFARKTMSLNMLSTVFRNVPLEGTNKVEVPFYDLDTSASQSFTDANGYDTLGNTVTAVREITIGQGAGAGAGDRKYIGLSFTSEEIARQPYLKILELAQLKVEKLASDIVADILSVVTAANYGAAVKTEDSAAFDSDDLVDIKLACKLWPDEGRSLILESTYDAALLKDPAFKNAFAAASDRAIKEGKLFPRVFGFDYMENPTLPENAEKLVGMALFKSAILAAFAPVPPVEEVRNAGTTYEIFIDPVSGVTLEYRTFGDNTKDAGKHIAESSYGYVKGNGNALKRICRP